MDTVRNKHILGVYCMYLSRPISRQKLSTLHLKVLLKLIICTKYIVVLTSLTYMYLVITWDYNDTKYNQQIICHELVDVKYNSLLP